MDKTKKSKPRPKKLTREEQIKRDALALAQLIYDIYKEKKLKEKKDGIS